MSAGQAMLRLMQKLQHGACSALRGAGISKKQYDLCNMRQNNVTLRHRLR
jgi:hypothetical protein